MFTTFALLIAFQIKHFLADYPWQTPAMLKKFDRDPKIWIPALSKHCGVHATLTFLICIATNWKLAIPLAMFDFAIHFAMDRIKASPDLLGRFKCLAASEFATATELQKDGNKKFWWSLGIDQTVHHLTHYAIIAILVCSC